MSFPAARVTDMHVCPMVAPGVPPIPAVGGPIMPPCMVTVLTLSMPQARMGDMCMCTPPTPPHPIAKGSTTVFVGNLPAARMMVDMCSFGGPIMTGAPTVLIGG